VRSHLVVVRRDTLQRLALSRRRLVNNGGFSRPRYEAQFAKIPLNVPGSYEYTVSRFPAGDAYIMLATPSGPSVASIERLTTKVRLRVVDQNNEVQCDATGSPGRTDLSMGDQLRQRAAMSGEKERAELAAFETLIAKSIADALVAQLREELDRVVDGLARTETSASVLPIHTSGVVPRATEYSVWLA
jgi:hypothetical protein